MVNLQKDLLKTDLTNNYYLEPGLIAELGICIISSKTFFLVAPETLHRIHYDTASCVQLRDESPHFEQVTSKK
ncbi:hypothetical protein [Dulcicalothrix desertica]|nr:hypothetical protein [Dulcicalothrix desertica]